MTLRRSPQRYQLFAARVRHADSQPSARKRVTWHFVGRRRKCHTALHCEGYYSYGGGLGEGCVRGDEASGDLPGAFLWTDLWTTTTTSTLGTMLEG